MVFDKQGIGRLKISIKDYPKIQKSAIISRDFKNMEGAIN
jgi:hypothetical protein